MQKDVVPWEYISSGKTFQSLVKKDEVLHEAKVMLALQNPEHHQCLPFLLGVNCSLRPYIIVTQFFGDSQMKLYTLKLRWTKSCL